jgi:hypothetical protein
MRAFGSNGYLLRHARLEVRLAYTGFLALVVVGLMTMAAFQLYHIGPTPDRIAAYYRGGEVGGEMTFPKTVRQLVEVTHFHAFIMGMVYLVLAHLFIATTVGPALKLGMIILAFAGMAGDLVAPWLVRYVSAGFAYAQLAAWLAEWIGFGALVSAPIVEMWFRGGEREYPPE